MKFTLEIELGNAQMRSVHDLNIALRSIPPQLLRDYPERYRTITRISGRKILDQNGNSVGEWDIKE